MRYLVDSDWLIDATGGSAAATDFLAQLSADGLAVSIIAVAEVFEGACRLAMVRRAAVPVGSRW